LTILLFANNAQSSLAAPISSTDTTVTLLSGTGALFPSPTAGQGFKLTFNDLATGLLTEIVLCTSRTGDVLTIVRAQEGTTAQSWLANDTAGMFYTAGSESNNIQLDQFQEGTYDNANAAGTANAIVATIPSNLNFVPSGFSFTLTSAFANTAAVTLNLTMGSTLIGALPIVKAGNTPLLVGDIPSAGYPISLIYSGVYNAYVMNNPATGNANSLSPAQLQQQTFTYAVATGSADSIAVSIPSTLTALSDGLELQFKAIFANGTTTPNLTVTLGSTVTGTYTIVKGSNQPLAPGDIPGANAICIVTWSATLNKWVLINAFPTLGSMASQNSNAVSITGGSISGISPPLPVASGGTGQASLNANAVLIGNGTGSVGNVPPSNIGQCLRSNGTSWYSGQVGLGISGETWHDVSASRSFNTVYTNNYNYPIFVAITGNGSNANWNLSGYVNGVRIMYYGGYSGAGSGVASTVSFIVPPGATYQAISFNLSAFGWNELY